MFEREIAQGINFLNNVYPGWVDKINLNELDMGNSRKCIIGQLYGDYCDIIEKLESEYGFYRLDYAFTSHNSYHSTLEWKSAILKLRKNNILDSIPEKFYSKEEVQDLLLDVMNLGMTLRQNQLNGQCSKSGREVLNEFIEKNLK